MMPTTLNFKAEALADDQLRLEAPSIFARGPMSGLSPRYAFVPTTEIVAALRERQWLPVEAEQQRTRAVTRLGFQKHLVRFRRAEQMQTLDEWNVELVLTNSHDACCAYVLHVGIFRRLCANGLVVSGEGFEAIRFRHAGLRAQEVVEASFRILDYAPRVGALIDQFRNRPLREPEAATFAEQALALRFPEPTEAPITPATLLTARRPEDQAADLWTTFNRVQENLIRGGLADGHHDRRGRLRTLRALRAIDSRTHLNLALWRLAEATLHARN